MDLETLFRTEYSPLRRLGQKSINCYEVTLRHFARHLGKVPNRQPGPPSVADLTDLTVARFLAERERETCRATAGRDRCQLLADEDAAAQALLTAASCWPSGGTPPGSGCREPTGSRSSFPRCL